MSWITKKISENAFAIEDSEADKTLRAGAITRPADGRWYVSLVRADGGAVSADFAKYETALSFVEGVETMQKIKAPRRHG